jgi:acyl-CoA thioesterase FadM
VPLTDLVAPPSFPACFSIGRIEDLVADPELGAHPNLVHGSQEFSYQRPIRGGDVLECTPRILDIADRGRMELLTFEIECVDWETKDPVVTARSVVVFFNQEGG